VGFFVVNEFQRNLKFELDKNFKNSLSESRVCRKTPQAIFLEARE
jgi:hypothetical protein